MNANPSFPVSVLFTRIIYASLDLNEYSLNSRTYEVLAQRLWLELVCFNSADHLCHIRDLFFVFFYFTLVYFMRSLCRCKMNKNLVFQENIKVVVLKLTITVGISKENPFVRK